MKWLEYFAETLRNKCMIEIDTHYSSLLTIDFITCEFVLFIKFAQTEKKQVKNKLLNQLPQIIILNHW